MKPFFAGQLAAIRRVDVQRYVTERGGKASAHSVQKELNVLKHLLRLAVEWELIPSNPATGSNRLACQREESVTFSRASCERCSILFDICPPWLRPIAGLALATGMRRSEILGLRLLDVDLQQKRVLLPQTENGDGRVKYLNELALSVIRSLPIGGRDEAD